MSSLYSVYMFKIEVNEINLHFNVKQHNNIDLVHGTITILKSKECNPGVKVPDMENIHTQHNT